jgi:hypothetical protein
MNPVKCAVKDRHCDNLLAGQVCISRGGRIYNDYDDDDDDDDD